MTNLDFKNCYQIYKKTEKLVLEILSFYKYLESKEEIPICEILLGIISFE